MPELPDELIDRSEAGAAPEPSVGDRRRPGRIANVNPGLIPLLRQATPAEAVLDDMFEHETDHLSAPRGLLISAAISAVIWAGIIFGLRSLL